MTISKNEPKARQQLVNILQLADLEDILEIYGDAIDEGVLQDQRYLNSRGRKGDGHTNFGIIFEKCKAILHSKGVAEERRHRSADFFILMVPL